MELTITNRDIWTAIAPPAKGASSALQLLCSWPMSPKSSRVAQKLARKIGEEATDLDAVRIKLCQEHAKKDDAGNCVMNEQNGYVLADEIVFAMEWNAHLDESVTLKEIRAIRDDEISESARPTAAEMARLGPFLIEAVS